MRVGLQVRDGRPAAEEFAVALRNAVEATGSEVVSDDAEPEIVIAVGGDGTMLAATRRALAYDVPVLGFNLGTMGFLTEAEPEDLIPVIERLDAGDFEIDERLTVAADVDGVVATGVNDVVVEKIDSQRLVVLAVSIDDSEFITYRSDGLIVATPTGSTAYAFSAGGPLVDPSIAALILAPVATHSLFDRPLVLPAETEITVRVVRDRSVHVTVDKNDLGHIAAGESVKINRGPQPAKFVTLGERTFAELLKEKFGLS